MNIKTLSILALSALLLAGCAHMKVRSEPDTAYDFSAVKTYQWVPGPSAVLEKSNTYVIQDLQDALDTEFQKKGLHLVSTNQTPDIHVAYYLKLKDSKRTSRTSDDLSREFSGGLVRTSDGWKYEELKPDINVYMIEEGTLVLLVYDAKTGTRVWRGTLQTEIDRSRGPEERLRVFQTAARKLLDRYPH